MPVKNDTFYFLKVAVDLPNCEEVAAIQRMKHGSEYLWLWMCLAFHYTNYGGVLCRRIGDQVIPVSADDIEAEMKGGFTDTSIKDGIATLIRGNLIYINSNGFMTITGLEITGDPLEPYLHKQNSNERARPISVGKDTKSAQRQRDYRLEQKRKNENLLSNNSYSEYVSYSDLARKLGCVKQTVSNTIKRHSLESTIKENGQKKMIPKYVADYLTCVIKGKKVPQAVLEKLNELDIFRQLDNSLKSNNDVNDLSNGLINNVHQLSSTVYALSNENQENPNKYSVLDSYSNESMNETHNEALDITHPLIESKEFRNSNEESIYRRAWSVDKKCITNLYKVGFDTEPTTSELSLLYDLLQTEDYSCLLDGLKQARRWKARSVAYVAAILRRNNNSYTEIDAVEKIDPERNITVIKNTLVKECELFMSECPENLICEFEDKKRYYSDSELMLCIREMSAYECLSVDGFEKCMKRVIDNYGGNENRVHSSFYKD